MASLALAPLGIPLAVELVGSGDLDMLSAACRPWHGVPVCPTPRLRLRIEAASEPEEEGEIRITLEDGAMRLRGGGVEGTADPASGQAACRVPLRYLATPDLLRSAILDPLVLYLLGRNDRAPVHASCFLAGDLAVLLAGPSGSGKSCLAHAAHAAGFPVLSEDVVYVQLRPQLRAWGWPGPVHLFPANAPRDGAFPQRVRNGKTKLAVPLGAAGSPAMSATRAVFCLLERGGAVGLERVAPAAAMRRLGQLEPGFDVMAAEVRAAHEALARNGAWRLTLSADPREAIGFLAANLAMLHEAAVA
jgi:hypothetical protein